MYIQTTAEWNWFKKGNSGMKPTVLTKVKALTARPTNSSVKEASTTFILTMDGQHFRIQEGDKLSLTQEDESSLGKQNLNLGPHAVKRFRRCYTPTQAYLIVQRLLPLSITASSPTLKKSLQWQISLLPQSLVVFFLTWSLFKDTCKKIY